MGMFHNVILEIVNGSLKYFVLLIVIYTSTTHEEELCGSLNGKTAYLPLGERGNMSHSYQAQFNPGNDTTCGVELVTCPACIIRISFENFNLSNACDIKSNGPHGECACKFIRIWEPIEPKWSVKNICNSTTASFVSITRSVRIQLQLHNNQATSFVLFYSAERNSKMLTGNIGNAGQFHSPYFPNYYPQDIGQQLLFSCKSVDCRVMVEFSDFLLAASSIIEVFDWDGKRIHIFSGITFRPPIILSAGPSMLIKFYGNGGTSYGYRGFYNFLNASDDLHTGKTECGGEVTDFGGVIIMGHLDGYYNCYWIIRPLNIIPSLKTHIYLKIISVLFNGVIEIKSGIISKSETLESVTSSQQLVRDFKEHIIALNVGFYVSLKGKMNLTSRIVIAYTIFNYMDCIPQADLKCNNKRCIPLQLSCDGFDNCGDNSDEPTNCDSGPIFTDYQRYFFPKTQLYTDIGATQVFIISCVLLLVVVFGLMVALCRIGIHARSRRELSSHIRTISQLLHVNQLEDSDDPPVYEPPPEYNQVVKPLRPHKKRSTQRIEVKNGPSAKNRKISENNMETTTSWKYAKPECNQTSNGEGTSISTTIPLDYNFQQFDVNTFNFNEDNFDASLSLPSAQGGIHETIPPTLQQKCDTKWIPSRIYLFKKIESNTSINTFNSEVQTDKRLKHLVRSQSCEDMLWNPEERSRRRNNYESDGNFASNAIIEGLSAETEMKILSHQMVKNVCGSYGGHQQRTSSDNTVSIPISKSYPGRNGDYFYGEV